jgi:hypothetical protein
MTGFGIWPVLLIITVIITVFLLARCFPGRLAAFRPSTERRPLVRLICAVLGSGILVTVAIASWYDAHGPYRTADASGLLTLAAPANPHPVADLDLDVLPSLRRPMVGARFLLCVFIGPATPAGFSACHRQEWDVRWPGQKQQAFTGAWSGESAQVDYSFSIGDLMDAQITDRKGKTQQVLAGNCNFRCEYRIGFTKGISSGEIIKEIILSEAGYVCELGDGRQDVSHPWSITTPSAGPFIMLATLTPLKEGETLVEQPVAGFLADYQGRLMARRQVTNVDHDQHIPMRGLDLAVHLGHVTILLLMAVFLLTQCFRHRQLALVGVLSGVVLFVVVLDRMVVGIHLRRLDDPQISVDQRLLAAHGLRNTFFHRDTARRHVQAIMNDTQSPESLRTALARMTESP